MNYSGIIGSDIANGTGVRVSLFVSGCTHHCKGCFNPDTWDFAAGEPFTENTEEFLLKELANPWVQGLSLLGGEPMEPANQRVLVPFLRRMKARLPDKDVWCYTGCVLERDLQCGGTPLGVAAAPSPSRAGVAAAPSPSRAGVAAAPSPSHMSYWRTEVTDEFLSYIDVLVDGPFIEALKDISLKFRGSSNQRLMHLKDGQVVSVS